VVGDYFPKGIIFLREMCRDLFPGNLWQQLLIHRVNVWGNYQGVCPDSLAGLQVSVSSGYDKVTITDLRDPVFMGHRDLID